MAKGRTSSTVYIISSFPPFSSSWDVLSDLYIQDSAASNPSASPHNPCHDLPTKFSEFLCSPSQSEPLVTSPTGHLQVDLGKRAPFLQSGDLPPKAASHLLCDFKQVVWPLWALVFSSAKGA